MDLFENNTTGVTDTGVLPISDQSTNTSALTRNTIVGIGDKYTIDITGLIRKWRSEDTPFLTIMENLGGGSISNPYHTWIDEYEGDSWIDIKLDEFRAVNTVDNFGGTPQVAPMGGYGSTLPAQAVQIGNSSYQGGSYKFLGLESDSHVTFEPSILNVSGVGSAANVEAALDTATSLTSSLPAAGADKLIAFKTPSSGIIGSAVSVYNNIRQIGSFLGYNVENQDETHPASVTFGANSKTPLYFAFDDLYYVDSNNDVHHVEEVMMRVESVVYHSGSLYFVLNITQSNTVGVDDAEQVLLANQAINSASTDHPELAGLISHPSRMAMIGLPIDNDLPNPEGGRFTPGGNLNFGRERKENYVEIFRSKSYGITGTHQASKFRFGDDFAKTRAMYMAKYKKTVNYKLLTGIKSEVLASNSSNAFADGQPARSLGGLLDYSLFPINYKRVDLKAASSAADSQDRWDELNKYIDSIANGTFAFRNSQGSQNITLLCSKAFLRRLSPYVSSALNHGAGMGGTVQINQPSEINFGIKSTTFISTDGIRVNFVHEPALDYMVHFPLAYHQFGTNSVRPQDILINVDFQNVRKMTFRNDRIIGSIQDIGQDAFLEGITGDHTFELSFPKNHGIIYSPVS